VYRQWRSSLNWRRSAKAIDSKKQKPKVFIGSSTEAVKYAEAIKAKLQDVVSFTIWRSKKNWQPGLSTLENLIKLLSEHDFAVLILDAEDVTNSRGQVSLSPRDNIIFELGLFMGHLGRCRTFFLCRKIIDLKIPSDLKGITSIPFDGPPHQAKRAVAGACQYRSNTLGRSASEIPHPVSATETRT